ncbi:hypothetical protein MHTCC0001_18710 [Flavobacteriaceae bacterium MHTCC 0001]
MRVTVFIISLFLAIAGANAQQKVDYLHFPKKIDSIVRLSQDQKYNIELALEDLNNHSEDISDEKNTNRYYKKVYDILLPEQKKQLMVALIDKQEIAKNVKSQFEDYFQPKGFPKHHTVTIKAVLRAYENVIAYNTIKYIFDPKLADLQNQEIYSERTAWVTNQYEVLNKTLWLWNYGKKLYKLDDASKIDFMAYHFNFYLKEDALDRTRVFLKEGLMQGVNKEGLQHIIKTIAKKEAKSICKTQDLITQQEPDLITEIKKAFTKKIKEELKAQKKEDKAIVLVDNGYSYEEIKEVVDQVKESYLKNKREALFKTLTEKAKKAGLDESRITKLIALIKQKEEDITTLMNSTNTVNSASLFEVNTQKTIHEIREEFSTNIANLISKKEFANILGDDLLPTAMRNAEKETEQVLSSYNFTEVQQEQVSEKIKLYYFNEIITKHYYNYQWELQKQKLGGLRYHFEKEFKKMLDEFNVKLKPSKKADNTNFQY